MGFSAIITDEQKDSANAVLEDQGYGPDNFSVPLVPTADTAAEPTHWGMNVLGSNPVFLEVVSNLSGVSVQIASRGIVGFIQHAADLGLVQKPPAGDDDGR